jgi:glutamate mutase epsilon subunit
MVEEWMKENELAIESGLRAEIVEDFIGGLKNLFAEHYIDIPEEKVDVVQEMADKVEELEAKLNEEISRSIEFKKEINEHKRIQALQTVCEGLTQTQVEKLKSLAESVEFTSEEEFADKLNTLKEAYTPSNVKAAEKSVLEEGVEVPEDKPAKQVSGDPLINAAVNSISKSVAK